MTIILSVPYSTFAAGATVDLDNATEAALVVQGLGAYTVNPGPAFFPLTGVEQQNVRDQAPYLQGLGSIYQLSRVLSQTGIPIIIPTSGSIGNNGALSGITALSDAFLPQGMYLYFPANAIVAGSAAGLYYTVLATTTTGTIFNNTYSSGIPSIPTTPTPFVTTGPGAFTQTTASDITLLSLPISANAMGPNGTLLSYLRWTMNSSANNKILSAKLNAISEYTNTLTTVAIYEHIIAISNRGVVNRQQASRPNNPGFGGGTSGTTTNTTVDTSAAMTLNITGQIALATDFLGISWHSVQLQPAA